MRFFNQVLGCGHVGFLVSQNTFPNSYVTFANTFRPQEVAVCLQRHAANPDSVHGGHDFDACIQKRWNEPCGKEP